MIRFTRSAPAQSWRRDPDHIAVIETSPIGFAGAAEEERHKWLNGFRRLLDALDIPIQVVVEMRPGSEEDPDDSFATPSDFEDMRGADLSFACATRRSTSAHTVSTSLAIAADRAARLLAALGEMGVQARMRDSASTAVFGRELAHQFLHTRGFSRTWYAERLPGTDLDPGWLFRLLPPGLALTLSWHATPLPAAWIVNYLQRQLINMRAARLLDTTSMASDPALAGALPNAEDLQRRLASSQDKAFHVSMYLTLTSPSRDQLALGSRQVESAARAILCDLQPCTFRMRDGFLATEPGGPDRLQRKRVLDSTALVTFFPWHEPDLQQPGGLFVGRNRATGSPVLVDPFEQRCFVNANIGVFGHSGAGKTYLLSTLAMGALGSGTQVFIVDPEHEYGGLARRLGGVDVELALGSGHALNVLDLSPDHRSDEAWLGPAAADAVDLCACVCGGLDESERALVEGAARQAYDEVAEPVLRDVAERLPRGSRLAVILHRWVNGSLGQMFSAPTNVDLEAPIVVFGMRELRDEMVAPVHFLLAEALWTRIKRKDRRRMLVIDELGLLFEDATIRRFVVSLARRIRKYHGSLVFATQNPGDLLSSDQGAVVATNPALAFFGAQRPSEAAKLELAFHLSPRQRGFLETARRGDFLLAAGADRLTVQVKAPPWQEHLMRLARSAARPPPRRVGLLAHGEGPPSPSLRPARASPRTRPRTVRRARGRARVALRPAVGGKLTVTRFVRDGVLPAPQEGSGPAAQRCRFREDGGRRNRRPDHDHLHARPQCRVRHQRLDPRRRPSAGQAAAPGFQIRAPAQRPIARRRARQATCDQESRGRAHLLLPADIPPALDEPTEPGVGLRPVRHQGLRADSPRGGAGGAQDPERVRPPWRLKAPS
ncbi:MAG: DUF87 domain-containing protein [Chloroflexi bacterium]|nr:MAG: DUF87 domain-containing protein [Chloroflexota bacterium]